MGKLGHPDLAVLLHRSDYLAVAASRRKAATPGLVLQALPWGDQHPPPVGQPKMRVGITTSKKVGNAVARNRARRRLRALARDVLPTAANPGCDYVLIGRASTPDRNYVDLKGDLVAALQRVRQRVGPQAQRQRG